MKKVKKTLIRSLATLSLVVGLVSGVSVMGAKEAIAAENTRKITVSGEGKVSIKPDVAYVNVGVTTDEADAKTAQKKNSDAMSILIKAIKATGIEEKDIKTSNFSMYPKYDYEKGNKITGYTVLNNVTITVRNIDKVGEILNISVENGGNVGSGVSFSILDSSKYYSEALALAISNAQVKASSIAKTINKNLNLSEPIEITEIGGNYTTYARTDTVAGKVGYAFDSAVPIQVGELEVTANVQVVYAY